MKKLLSTLHFMLCLGAATAQVQQGYVRTLERPNQQSQALSGVTIRIRGGHNAVVSGSDGRFSMAMTGKRPGDAYVLQQVQKQGYEVSETGFVGRQLAFSDRVPLTIVMVNTAQLQADKRRIEDNAYRVAERNYHTRLAQIEEQLAAQTISAEQYRQQLHELQDGFERFQQMIDGLADHYAHTDYDGLSDKEREVNILIENGDLERADSLLCTLFDPVGVIERNRQALAAIDQQEAQARQLLAEANAQLAAVLRQQERDAEHLYQLYTIALANYDNEKAAHYIELRAELDTTNVKWQIDAGEFASDYIADYNKAKRFFQRGLSAAHILEGEKGRFVSQCINHIGYANLLMGDYANSMPMFEQAYSMRQEIEPNLYDLSESQNLLGFVAGMTGDINKALGLFEQSLENIKQALGVNSNEVGSILLNIGSVKLTMGRYDDALLDMEQSLEIFKNVYGSIHPTIANAINNIGTLYFNMNDYNQAERCFIESYEMRKTIFGEMHPKVALMLANIGTIYEERGDYAKALEYQEKAYGIRLQILGEQAPEIGESFLMIGKIYNSMGNNDKAIEMISRGLGILQNVFGSNHPIVAKAYNNLGSVYTDTEQHSLALENYKLALAIYQSIYGENHYELAPVINNIGYAYFKLNKYDDALTNYERALAINKSFYGEIHATGATIIDNIASVNKKKGDYQHALALYEEALDIYRQVLGEAHPSIATTLNNIGTVYEERGDYAMALSYYEQALSMVKQFYDEQHPDVIFYMRGIQSVKEKMVTEE